MTNRRLSHAYMLIGPPGEEADQTLRHLTAALLCQEENAPCGSCRDCRKVFAGIHPDVTFVDRQTDDRGRRRQEILVGQIRAAVSDAYIAPNEGFRKVYVIREADRMNTEAQNALLKALEEPPGHACFLLCAAAADALLPTVRSRCVRIDDTDRRPALPGLSDPAREYVRLCAEGSPADMTRFCLLRGKLDREDAEALLTEIRCAMADISAGRRDNPGLDPAAILRTEERLARAEELLRRNISSKQVFGLLAAQYDLGESHDRRNNGDDRSRQH